MSKRKNYSPPAFLSKTGHGHFTPIYDDLIESDAYIRLKPEAARLLLYLYQQYRGTYTSGDTVICPYSYLEARGFRHASIPKWLSQLEQAGFIRIIRGGLMRTPNRYQLIDAWYRSQ